jgi:hypothetical protein
MVLKILFFISRVFFKVLLLLEAALICGLDIPTGWGT